MKGPLMSFYEDYMLISGLLPGSADEWHLAFPQSCGAFSRPEPATATANR
jgi:hypothetical protein